MSTTSLNRIRILKTGLAHVQLYMDMTRPENRAYFESLAEPGTQLKLKRVRDDENDPCRIDVYSPDDRYLGHVTLGKNETTARLMDAGLKVAAIVNSSMPVHDSDISIPQAESDVQDSRGWDEESRIATQYEDCNLPYCIYIRRTRYNMEYKLNFEIEESSQVIKKLYKPELIYANDVVTSQRAAGSEPERCIRVPILKCSTVRLRNFTDEYSEPGRQLMLIREPDNPYDRWAIKICSLTGVMFGYLPARKNQSVARLMDAGKKISAYVDECSHIHEMGYFNRSGEDPLLPVVIYLLFSEEIVN